jgi:peroxiredoxin Q/BCP
LGQVFVGETAPNFELDGSQGNPVKLSKLRGTWIVLAFADRRQQLGNLRDNIPELRQLGAQFVGVCHEKSQTLVSFVQRDSIPFLMLADVTGEVSAVYGLYNHELSETRPGFFVLDRKGAVRMAVLGQLLPGTDIARLARIAITGL